MGISLVQTDISWLDGPDDNRCWDTGTLARQGIPVKHGWASSSPNTYQHDPTGTPPVYFPQVMNFVMDEGVSAGSSAFYPRQKTGPITSGCLSHCYELAADDIISAGNWVLRLDTPIQTYSNQEIIEVAVGTFYRNTPDPGTSPPSPLPWNFDWSNGSSILAYTWGTPIALSQISAQNHSVTVAGSAVSLPAGKDGYFLYISWIFKNGLASNAGPDIYSKQTYDTQVTHSTGRIVTLGARHVTESRLVLPTQGF